MDKRIKINWLGAILANTFVIAVLMLPGILAIWCHNWMWLWGFFPHLVILSSVGIGKTIAKREVKQSPKHFDEHLN